MSIQYCHKCGKNIDTDFNAEHFEECYKDFDPSTFDKGFAFEVLQRQLNDPSVDTPVKEQKVVQDSGYTTKEVLDTPQDKRPKGNQDKSR